MPTLAQLALMQKVNQAAHGVSITVTPPGGSAVTTTGIWHDPLIDTQPLGSDFRRRDPRRVMEIPLTDTLTDVPRGSTVVAADRDGGSAKTWRADGLAPALGIGRFTGPLRCYVILVPA